MAETNNVHFEIVEKTLERKQGVTSMEIEGLKVYASMAVAHELRTQNLIALRAQEVSTARAEELLTEILERLYG
jgi:hypothetical protein